MTWASKGFDFCCFRLIIQKTAIENLNEKSYSQNVASIWQRILFYFRQCWYTMDLLFAVEFLCQCGFRDSSKRGRERIYVTSLFPFRWVFIYLPIMQLFPHVQITSTAGSTPCLNVEEKHWHQMISESAFAS